MFAHHRARVAKPLLLAAPRVVARLTARTTPPLAAAAAQLPRVRRRRDGHVPAPREAIRGRVERGVAVRHAAVPVTPWVRTFSAVCVGCGACRGPITGGGRVWPGLVRSPLLRSCALPALSSPHRAPGCPYMGAGAGATSTPATARGCRIFRPHAIAPAAARAVMHARARTHAQTRTRTLPRSRTL
jgi:hypothetical protein